MFTATSWKYSDKGYTGPEIRIEESPNYEGKLYVQCEHAMLNTKGNFDDGFVAYFDNAFDAQTAVEQYVKQWKEKTG